LIFWANYIIKELYLSKKYDTIFNIIKSKQTIAGIVTNKLFKYLMFDNNKAKKNF